MDNFDLKKYLAEGRLNKAYDISAEVTVGDKFYDSSADIYEVISVDTSHVELEPINFAGDTTIFPKDFGDNVSIGDFWQHFEKIEDEPKGLFGEPWDSNDFGRHL